MAEPLLPAMMAASVVAALGSPAQTERWLPAIAEGHLLAVLAHSERHMRLDRGSVRTEATRDGADWRLRGAKDAVVAAGAAGLLLVTARIGEGDGRVRGRNGSGDAVLPRWSEVRHRVRADAGRGAPVARVVGRAR